MSEVEEEFSEFVAHRSDALYRTAFFLAGGDVHLAHDLVQDALAAAFVRWRRVRDPNAREAYVRKILVRGASRRWSRPSHSREWMTAAPPESGHDGHEVTVQTGSDFVAALSTLPPKQRAVIVLRYYLDLTEAEIAEALDCAPGTVKTHASRGLAALKGLLTDTPYAPTYREET